MYLYEGHMGSLYVDDEYLDYDDLYCDTCGDSDWLIGNFDSAREALIYMADDINVDECGGWDIEYALEVLNMIEDDPENYIGLEEAEDIVRKNRHKEIEEE